MHATPLRRAAALAAVSLLLAACSGGSSAATATTGAVASSIASVAASGGPASSAGTGGGTGAGVTSLNACNFLTTAQIQSIVGWAVGTGVLQNTDNQTDCEWTEQGSDGFGVGLTIATFDPVIWQAGSTAGQSAAVSGLGDAAFKGWPHAGDLAIKVKGYMVTVAIIDLAQSVAKVDAETVALANLVLPQL